METEENELDNENAASRIKHHIPKNKSKSKRNQKHLSHNPETSHSLTSNEDQVEHQREPSPRTARHPRPNTLVPPGQSLGRPSRINSHKRDGVSLPRELQGKHRRIPNPRRSRDEHEVTNPRVNSRQSAIPESSNELGKRIKNKGTRRPWGVRNGETAVPRTTSRPEVSDSSGSSELENRNSRRGRNHGNTHNKDDLDGRSDHNRLNPDHRTVQLRSSDNGNSSSRSASVSSRSGHVSPSLNIDTSHTPSATVVIAESESDIDTPRSIRKDVTTEIIPRIELQHLHTNSTDGNRPSRHQPNEPNVVHVGAHAAVSPLSDEVDNIPASSKGLLSGELEDVNSGMYDEPPPAYSTVDRRYDIVPGPNYGYTGQSVMFTDPPPSYRDLFHESVRQTVTRLSSSNSRSGFLSNSTGGHACCTALFVIVVVGFAVVLPIAMIGVGVHHLYDCPAEPRIPIYLIVAAIFQMIECCGRLTYYAQEQRNPSNRRKHRDPCIYFVLIWFVIGSIWVYQTSPVFVEQQTVYVQNVTITKLVPTAVPSSKEQSVTPTVSDYCDKKLYFFAFWLVTIYYLAIGFFFTMIIISIFVHTMVTFCRRFTQISRRFGDGGERV